jgi:uroporphyrin-III C-methyltransferase / precorrin-2 dehydrogenase / sirohydrochlorin ferrochelatase
VKSLPLFHQVAGQPVIVLGDGEAAEAKRRLVERAGGFVVGDDNREARLAFVALDHAKLQVTRLKARGVLVNVVDRPELCDFTVPSLLDRDPVLVAVGTAGASAGLAKQLRLRLEGLLPANLGKLAEALHAARDALRERWPAAEDRRRALDAALTQGGPLDPLDEGSPGRFEAWLRDALAPAPGETVTLTIASDDPDDLTLRQARLLGTADCILFDPGIAPAILDRARADAVRLPLPHEGPLPDGVTLRLHRAGDASIPD